MTYLPDTNAWIGFLTHNTREFSGIASLKIEDWEL
jgi:predicted nucleic acid-binding protein